MTTCRGIPRRLGHVLLLIALAAVLAGCAPPMQVYSHWGSGLRFSETTRSYDWGPDAERTSGEDRPQNPRVDELIRQAIEKELAVKGYEKTTAASPDFWIDYRVARNLRRDPYGGGHFVEFAEGSLALYVVDPANGKLIWRGIVQSAMDETASPDERARRLDLATKKLLAQVPSRKAPG